MEKRLEQLETHMERICSLLEELVKPVRQKRIEQTVVAELRTERIKHLRGMAKKFHSRFTIGANEIHDELEELEQEDYIEQEVKERLKYELTKKHSKSRIKENVIYGESEDLEEKDSTVLDIKESSK